MSFSKTFTAATKDDLHAMYAAPDAFEDVTQDGEPVAAEIFASLMPMAKALVDGVKVTQTREDPLGDEPGMVEIDLGLELVISGYMPNGVTHSGYVTTSITATRKHLRKPVGGAAIDRGVTDASVNASDFIESEASA